MKIKIDTVKAKRAVNFQYRSTYFSSTKKTLLNV